MYQVTSLGHNMAMENKISPRMVELLNKIDQEINDFSASEIVMINRALDEGYII